MRYQRHRCKSGNHADGFPAREVLFQNYAGEQNGYDRVERREHDGGIESANLTGADEEDSAAYVQAPGEQA
jgi:hypothetical protein